MSQDLTVPVSTGYESTVREADHELAVVVAPVDGPGKVRGFGILNSLRFATARFGDKALVDVMRALTPEDQRTVLNLRRTRWYPFALHCRVLRAVDLAHGEGDHALLYELGKYSAERDLPRFFHPLLRRGRPGWIFEFSTKLWRFYHGEGRWILERTPAELIARLEDFDEADAAFCVSFIGYVHAALELSGARDVVGSHPTCRAEGGAACVYTVRWSL